jgi:hypothetical protein
MLILDAYLEIRDFEEMEIAKGKVTFTRIPTLIRIRRSLTKRAHTERVRSLEVGYLTFLNDEGCEYVRDYLEWRMKKEEILTPSSPLIPTEKGTEEEKVGSHVTTEHASYMLKEVVLGRQTV